jgi:hypothetical protein
LATTIAATSSVAGRRAMKMTRRASVSWARRFCSRSYSVKMSWTNGAISRTSGENTKAAMAASPSSVAP